MTSLPRSLKISLPIHSHGSLPSQLSEGLAAQSGSTTPKQSLKRPLAAPTTSAADPKLSRILPESLDSKIEACVRSNAVSNWPSVGSSAVFFENSSHSTSSLCSSGSGSPPNGGSDGGCSGEEGPAPNSNSGGSAGVMSTVDMSEATSLQQKSPPTSNAPLELADEATCTELRWDAAGPHFWAVVQPGSPPRRLLAAGLLNSRKSECENPEVFLAKLLEHDNRNPAPAPGFESRPDKGSGPQYRRLPTPKMVADYDLELVSAVRERDFECLRRLHAQGRSLDACNKYGESVMHAACRRGDLAIAQALMDLGATPLAVDDFGRTPLHDACWAPEPCLDLVALLLAADPQSVLLKDSRGSGPLAYIRKEHHGVWCAFLNHMKDEFFPLQNTATMTTEEAVSEVEGPAPLPDRAGRDHEVASIHKNEGACAMGSDRDHSSSN